MNKIKQNKITFTLILTLIAIIFSSLTILSLPVLFNYKSKVAKIEKNFYENFKFYLNSSGKVYYKPFPKPHLLVENATLNLSKNNNKNDIIKTSNLKIFISLRDVYLRSFQNFISTNISDTNINLKIDDIKEFRKHLYKTINNKVTFTNCKIFIRNEENKVILISQIKKISYKINNKTKIKNFLIDGKIFGLDFKSDWKRSYDKPKISINNIKIFNPNIDIKNIYNFENKKIFDVITEITHNQDKLVYNINFDNYKINIKSPNDKNTNFNLFGTIELRPFYFDGELVIRNKKVEKIIDNFLINFLLYDESFLGNLNGKLKIEFKDLKNKLIKNGKINLILSQRKINLNSAEFNLGKIGNIKSDLSYSDTQSGIRFISKNQLNIKNHIEFAKIFQIGSNKIKNIKKIHFDLEKEVGSAEFTIKNVKVNSKIVDSSNTFVVKNIQNLRSYIRNVID